MIDEKGHLKIIDFGLAKEFAYSYEKSKNMLGTWAYMTPEMLFNWPCGQSMDWYNIGTLLYELLTGKPPYYAKDLASYQSNIKFAELQIPDFVDEDASDLIRKLMIRQPLCRLGAKGAEEVKYH